MIIKSHIRGGFRSAAEYLKEQGKNEKTRLVEMSDPQAKTLDEAFRAMWAVADSTRAKKPLHHISINPMKDERLTDEQVRRICERLEEKYGYASGEHQRVIVEHVRDGRQHFHVIWNRVSLTTGKPHYPYMHKKQSKIAAREMEAELGLKKPVSRFSRTAHRLGVNGRYAALHAEIDAPQITTRRKRKGGKGDSTQGSGGGMASATSVFKSSERKEAPLQRQNFLAKPRKAYWGGPNRRYKKVYVAVERRDNG